MVKKVHCLAAAGLLVAGQASWAEQGSWSVGTGYNFSSGKYGTDSSTDITTIPFTTSYEQGAWSVKLTVPYVRIEGSEDVVIGVGKTKLKPGKSRGNGNGNGNGGGGGGGGSTTTSTTRSESGLGDVTLGATYNFYSNPERKIGADVTARVKFGTADVDKGLGTGENDYSLALDVYKLIDRWTLFGGLGYSVMGSSGDYELDNVFNASAGGIYRVSERGSVGLAYDYRQKTSSEGDALSELSAFYVHRFDRSWKAQAYLLTGFSDGSPDWGGGVSLGYAF